MLPFIDCLITDYSAIYHDFLLKDKPIWFIPYDYDDYKNQNGFLYDFFKLLPGPNINSFQLLIENLKDLSTDIDKYREQRHRLLNLIHKYRDSSSSKRVFELIQNITVKRTN